MIRHRFAVVTTVLMTATSSDASAQNEERRFENLQVLPANISNDSLSEIMLDNLRGLGLPRLAGSGCLFCHVGDMDEPRTTWDYASDANPMKAKARVMMSMVDAINQRHLPSLESRIDERLRVTCYTCHAGRTDPRPLSDMLIQAFRMGGIDSLTTTYTDLREKYFGADAYDFRVHVLRDIAVGLADKRDFSGAIAVAQLNVDANPDDPEAQRGWLRLVMERAFVERGIAAALVELDQRLPGLDGTVFTPGVLDNLGWRLYRAGHQDDARVLFDENVARFPADYVPQESLAFVLWSTGEQESAYHLLEQWISAHPDHERARRLLVNLKARERD